MIDRPESSRLSGMSPARWARIESLLDQALDLPHGEVAALLDRECAGDPSLRAEVEALLRADESAEEFLERPAGEFATELLTEPEMPAAAWAGRRVGAWELVRELGRGGMGTVFLARRADGAFEQQAALKLIRHGLDSEEILARFRRERQILARLEHPHIARLLDGGAAEDGTPYLVMEMVDGEPITAWFRRTRPTLERVLGCFGQICQAVQYAHQNLVVHRDLKPGNILIGAHGEVKLVDFGVARLLVSDAAEGLDRTSGERRMTPHYAAPEQVRGETPSTATDVYGLGVVLYELLCGVRPWEGASSSHDLERAILEATPEPPSRMAARAPADAWPGRAWAERLRGDLDAIVLQAMRKEPRERYASVQSLAEDIERFLAGLPVRASRGTWRYRAGKFVRRHRTGVAVAGVAALALIGGVAAVLWQARLAAQARDRAVLAARKADEINGFVLELLTAASPYGAPDPNLTAREIVANGESRVRSELAGQPEVQAQMFDVLGGIHREFEQFGKAESLVTEGLAIRRRLFGPRHALVASSLNSLGLVRMKKGDVAGADSVLRQALAMRQAMPDGDGVLESLTSLSVALDAAGHAAQAESLDRVALAMAERLYGPDHDEAAQQLNNLGAVLSQAGKIQEAVPLLERALAIRVAQRPRHNDVAITAELLAQCFVHTGDFARADSLLMRALVIREAWLPPGHGDRARTYDLLARVALAQGHFARSESMYVRAVDIRRGALGPLHPETGVSLNNLAVLYYFVRNLDQAARTFEQVHAAWTAAWGVDHTNTLTCYTNLAAVRREQGRYDESERMLRHALERRLTLFGDSAIGTSQVSHNLAQLLFQRGTRLDEAERLARHAIAIRQSKVGPATPPVAASQEVLATLLRERGRRDESLAIYREALNICRTAFDKPNPATADVLAGLGRLQLKLGRPREAEPLLAEALSIRSTAYPPGDLRTGEAQVAHGLCLAALGREADAAPLITGGLTSMRRRPGRPDPLIRDGEVALAQLRSGQAASASP